MCCLVFFFYRGFTLELSALDYSFYQASKSLNVDPRPPPYEKCSLVAKQLHLLRGHICTEEKKIGFNAKLVSN